MMYDPENDDPYLLLSIGGHILQVPCSPAADTDLSAAFALVNPAAERQAFFCQAEQFAIIQAGDYLTNPLPTLPLFWTGAALVRSNGIAGRPIPPGGPPYDQIPAAGPMCYYMGRLWYALDWRTYAAGDIVQGAAGTAGLGFRDSVLCVTENPLAIGGDGFVVPNNAGSIRAIATNGAIDTTTGQGSLYIFTTKAVYSLIVPVTRNDWIAAGATVVNRGPNAVPLQTVVQLTNGAVGDRSVVAVNGDLFYQSLEPGIRSLITAIRYFTTWGNTPISGNLERLLNYQDRALMRFSTGIAWNNRLLMGMRPIETEAGVAHQAVVALDFLPVASFGKKLPPCWEGHWEGLDVLQLFTGFFGGLERAFAVVVSRNDGSIQLWELTDYERWDYNTNGKDRTTMVIEFPAYNFGDPFQMKKLVTAELWLDKILGTVDFRMEYRPDADVCWYHWHDWQRCSQADCNDDPVNMGCYPVEPYRESHRTTMTLPKPPMQCSKPSNRPANQGYQFQCRLTIKGWCRVRGMLLHAEPMDRKLYKDMGCAVAPPQQKSIKVFVTEQTLQPLQTEGGEYLVPE